MGWLHWNTRPYHQRLIFATSSLGEASPQVTLKVVNSDTQRDIRRLNLCGYWGSRGSAASDDMVMELLETFGVPMIWDLRHYFDFIVTMNGVERNLVSLIALTSTGTYEASGAGPWFPCRNACLASDHDSMS